MGATRAPFLMASQTSARAAVVSPVRVCPEMSKIALVQVSPGAGPRELPSARAPGLRPPMAPMHWVWGCSALEVGASSQTPPAPRAQETFSAAAS